MQLGNEKKNKNLEKFSRQDSFQISLTEGLRMSGFYRYLTNEPIEIDYCIQTSPNQIKHMASKHSYWLETN